MTDSLRRSKILAGLTATATIVAGLAADCGGLEMLKDLTSSDRKLELTRYVEAIRAEEQALVYPSFLSTEVADILTKA